MSRTSDPSSLLEWFAANHPDQTLRAGQLVFIDVSFAPTVLDRAESAGIAVARARGFAVDGAVARRLDGQEISPDGESLLDCETPSGATCGAVRLAVTTRWAEPSPGSARHMVLLDLDERSGH